MTASPARPGVPGHLGVHLGPHQHEEQEFGKDPEALEFLGDEVAQAIGLFQDDQAHGHHPQQGGDGHQVLGQVAHPGQDNGHPQYHDGAPGTGQFKAFEKRSRADIRPPGPGGSPGPRRWGYWPGPSRRLTLRPWRDRQKWVKTTMAKTLSRAEPARTKVGIPFRAPLPCSMK